MFLTRSPTELLEPGPYVGELKAQSSSIQRARHILRSYRASITSFSDGSGPIADGSGVVVTDADIDSSSHGREAVEAVDSAMVLGSSATAFGRGEPSNPPVMLPTLELRCPNELITESRSD